MYLRLDTTVGTLWFRLLPDKSPANAAKLSSLCSKGYYNGKTFSNRIQDWMILFPQCAVQGDGADEENGCLPVKGALFSYKHTIGILLKDHEERGTVFGYVFSGGALLEKLTHDVEIVAFREVTPRDMPPRMALDGFPEIQQEKEFFTFRYETPHYFNWGASPRGRYGFCSYVLTNALGHFPLISVFSDREVLWTGVISRILKDIAVIDYRQKPLQLQGKFSISDNGKSCIYIPAADTIFELDCAGSLCGGSSLPPHLKMNSGDLQGWKLGDYQPVFNSDGTKVLLRQSFYRESKGESEKRERLLLLDTCDHSFHLVHEIKGKESGAAFGGFERYAYLYSYDLNYVAFLGTHLEGASQIVLDIVLFDSSSRSAKIFPKLPLKPLLEEDFDRSEYSICGSLSNTGDTGILIFSMTEGTPLVMWIVLDSDGRVISRIRLGDAFMQMDSQIQYQQSENLHLIFSSSPACSDENILQLFDCGGSRINLFDLASQGMAGSRLAADEKKGEMSFFRFQRKKRDHGYIYELHQRSYDIREILKDVPSREEQRAARQVSYRHSIETIKSSEEKKARLEHQYKYGLISEEKYREELDSLQPRETEAPEPEREDRNRSAVQKKLRADYIEGLLSWSDYYQAMKNHTKDILILNREERSIPGAAIPDAFLSLETT
jgi:hypothetical protein